MTNSNQKISLTTNVELCKFMGGTQWELDGKVVFANKSEHPYSILSCSPTITPDGANARMYDGNFPVNIPPCQAVSLALHIEFSLNGKFPQSLSLDFKDQNGDSYKEDRQILEE